VVIQQLEVIKKQQKKTKPLIVNNYQIGDYIIYNNNEYKIERVCKTFVETKDLGYINKTTRFYPKDELKIKVLNKEQYREKQQIKIKNQMMEVDDDYQKIYIKQIKHLSQIIDDILDEKYDKCVDYYSKKLLPNPKSRLYQSKIFYEEFLRFCNVSRFEICNEIIDRTLYKLEYSLYNIEYYLYDDDDDDEMEIYIKLKENEKKMKENEKKNYDELKEQLDKKELLNEMIKRGHFLNDDIIYNIHNIFDKYYKIFDDKPKERIEIMKNVKEIENNSYLLK
jgi:hypothetical protein